MRLRARPLAPTILLQEYDTRSRRRCASGLQAGAAFVCVMSFLDSLRISSRYAVAKTLDQDYSRRFWLIALIHISALGLMLSFEEGWAEKAAFVLTWGILNSHLARRVPASGDCRDPVAGARGRADRTVAAQARHRVDDDQLFRRADNRQRHRILLADDLSRPASLSDCRSDRCCAAGLPAVALRPFSGFESAGCGRRGGLPRCAHCPRARDP